MWVTSGLRARQRDQHGAPITGTQSSHAHTVQQQGGARALCTWPTPFAPCPTLAHVHDTRTPLRPTRTDRDNAITKHNRKANMHRYRNTNVHERQSQRTSASSAASSETAGPPLAACHMTARRMATAICAGSRVKGRHGRYRRQDNKVTALHRRSGTTEAWVQQRLDRIKHGGNQRKIETNPMCGGSGRRREAEGHQRKNLNATGRHEGRE